MQSKNKKALDDILVRVGRAKTGKGLFATQTILKGVRIIEYTGRPATVREIQQDSRRYLFWTSETTMINGNVPSNTARYINHSCRPNCEAVGPTGKIYIVSLQRIREGEELTYDYGKEYYDKHLGPDICKCEDCGN